MATDFTQTALRIQRLAKEAGAEIGSGLRVLGEHIMTDIKSSRPGAGVPVKTGALKSSGRVTGPTGKRNPKVRLSFGGSSAPYAVIQHENKKFRHRVGEARYLVRGVQRFQAKGLRGAPEVLDAMKKAARKALMRVRARAQAKAAKAAKAKGGRP